MDAILFSMFSYQGLVTGLLLLAVLFFAVLLHKKSGKENQYSQLDCHKKHDSYSQLVERIPSKEEEELEKDKKSEKVVGIAKPVGFWTKKVIGEKVEYLLAAMSSDNPDKHYWRSYIAKRREHEKGQGRSGPK